MDGGEPQRIRWPLVGDIRRSEAGSGRHRDDGRVSLKVAFALRACPWRSPRRRTVPSLFLAGAVVGVQIAESILNPRQHMSDEGALEVHLLIVTVCLIEHAAIADALNIAQSVVAVGTPGCCRLFGLVLHANFGVVDAGENVNPLSAE